MSNINIETAMGAMPAYIGRPEAAGPWPGVVVIHDAYGAGQNLCRHADWLASCGYLAIAPDLLHWNTKFTCLRSVMRDLAARRGRSFDDIEAARAWLRGQADCTGRIGIIGFCMGGAFAMLLAPMGTYAAAAPNYGKVPKDADKYFAGACPVVGSFGRRDPTLRGAAGKLERALNLNGIQHDVKEYPDTSHGFLDDHSIDKLPFALVMIKTLLRVGYHDPSAADAKRRIQSFFEVHLKAPAAAELGSPDDLSNPSR
jgi:carboxymethylenebutenolidase